MTEHTLPKPLELNTDVDRKLFVRSKHNVTLPARVSKQLFLYGQKIKQQNNLSHGNEIELAICDLMYNHMVS